MRIKPATTPGHVIVDLAIGDEQLLDRSHAPEAREPATWPLPLQNILVPIDFSDASRQALHYAIPLATRFGAIITLLHVIEPQVHTECLVMPLEASEADASLMAESRKQLEVWRREELNAGIASITILSQGRPHHQIIETAQSLKTDLIIISTHGRTGLKHALLGSTAEKVVRGAPCPVLTLRRPGAAPAPPDRSPDKN